MTTPLPAAVLWDMDGTLVDTEPYWIAAETELVRSFGGDWTHADALQMVGLGLWEGAEILRRAGVDMTADAIVQLLTDAVQAKLEADGVPWRPGARELLSGLRERGIRTALVTMSLGRMAHQIAGLIDFPAFDAVISGDAVDHPKPHPDPYLRGAEAVGVDPRLCVAIEDSPPGVASAVAAGAVAIGVPHQVTLADTDADVLWPTLAGRNVDDLIAVFRAARSEGSLT